MALEPGSLFLDGDWIESKDIASDGIRYITTGNVAEGKYREQGAGYISELTFKTLKCTEVFEGDLLVSRLNDPIGRACKVPKLEAKIVTSVDNVIFRPDEKYYRDFVVYLFSSEGYFKHTSNLARGTTMQRISRGLLGNIRVCSPQYSEQRAIAAFLDHEAAKIDTLIEKQQKLIQLLKEKRQAVISHAVTKGLNPNAKMRDSGVEWLGEVPEHWIHISLKFYAQVIDCKHVTAEFLDDGVPLASIGEVKEKYINLQSAKMTSEKFYLELIGGGRDPRIGDIIYSRNATVGEAALVGEDTPRFAMGQDVCLIRFGNNIDPEFMLQVLKSNLISQQLELAMVGSTFKRINVDSIRSFLIALPPLEEQQEISVEICIRLTKHDRVIEYAESAIKLMQERRTALISAAVTGKIDVRDWAPPALDHRSEEAA
ncbi:MAG: restriction endonuclease subunit S [Pseudomonadota bacterium]